MRRIIISAIVYFIFLKGYSQEIISFRYADSLTYSLYLEKNWNDLIKTGKEAIGSGHDYFYMRMRLGIAFYERRNYSTAAKHFSKALEFNKEDPTALEYLFYSYYLSGKYFQAWTIIQELDARDRERILKESKIKKNAITVESFYLNTGTEELISNPDQYFTNPEAGSQVITKSFINNAVYLSHLTGKRSSYYHSFTNLIKDNYLHYFDGIIQSDLPGQRVTQNQYYGRFNIFTSTGWIFSPSFHILSSGYTLMGIRYVGMNYSTYTYKARTNDFAGGFGVTKTGGLATVSAEAVYSKLNNTEQIQGTLSVTFYPVGNRNIYLGGNIAAIHNPGANSSEIRIVSGFIAGFAIKDRVWFEFSGASGNMKNFNENNALVIYNGIDYLTGKYNGKIIVPFYKPGITLFAGAGFGTYSSEFLPSDGNNNFDPNKLNYKNYSITGGLSWNF